MGLLPGGTFRKQVSLSITACTLEAAGSKAQGLREL